MLFEDLIVKSEHEPNRMAILDSLIAQSRADQELIEVSILTTSSHILTSGMVGRICIVTLRSEMFVWSKLRLNIHSTLGRFILYT